MRLEEMTILQVGTSNTNDYYNGAFQHFLQHLDLSYPSRCSCAEVSRDQLVPSQLSRGKVRFFYSITAN